MEKLAAPNGSGLNQLKSTILHELGHALNLAHYTPKWGGEYQTMGSGQTGDYRSGDVNGLKYMAAGS